MEKVRLFASLERVIANGEEVEQILGDEAYLITMRARANLAVHRKEGTHRITQTKGKVDHFVNLEGDAALSVENGYMARNGRIVRGLDILKEAIL